MTDSGREPVIIVNRFAWPDQSATAQLVTDLAEHLARRGHSVDVVTGAAGYIDGTHSFASHGTHRDVHYHRLRSSGKGRYNLLLRLWDYGLFYLGVRKILRGLMREQSRIITLTDPPLVHAWLRLWFPKQRFIHWSMDVFPEVLVEVSRRPLVRICRPALTALRNKSLSKYTQVVALHAGMADHFKEISPQVRVIPNWSPAEGELAADPEELEQRAAAQRDSWGLSERWVIGYSGNLGRVHDAETVLHALPEVFDKVPEATFLFTGGGARLELFRAAQKTWGEEHIQIRPFQDRAQIPISLRIPDLHWLSLYPQFSAFVFPSKFAGICSVGRPMIYVGDDRAEIPQIIRAQQLGHAVRSGDSQGFTAAVEALRQSVESGKQISDSATRAYHQLYARKACLDKWEEALRA